MNNAVKAVIFDVDGVLLDSFEANFVAFRNLFTKAGYPLLTREEFVPLFHRTLRDIIIIVTGLTNEEEIEKLSAMFDTVESPPPTLSDGVMETIQELSKQYKLAIATSRVRRYAFEPPLDTLEHYFAASATYEDTKKHKPDPEPLLFVATKLGVSPQECVYIGDVENDFIAARAAGMKFIQYAKKIIQGVDASTSDFKEIPEIVAKLNN